MPPSKLEVNAAIDKLLSSENLHDLSYAIPVIEFMKNTQLSDSDSSQEFMVRRDEDSPDHKSDEMGKSCEGFTKLRVGFYEIWIQRDVGGKYAISFQHLQKLEIAIRKNLPPPFAYSIVCSEDFMPEYLATYEAGERVHWVTLNLKIGPWYYRVEHERIATLEVVLRGLAVGVKRLSDYTEYRYVRSCLPKFLMFLTSYYR